jgi:hypothetical protein
LPELEKLTRKLKLEQINLEEFTEPVSDFTGENLSERSDKELHSLDQSKSSTIKRLRLTRKSTSELFHGLEPIEDATVTDKSTESKSRRLMLLEPLIIRLQLQREHQLLRLSSKSFTLLPMERTMLTDLPRLLKLLN